MGPLNLSSSVRATEDVVFRELDGEAVLLNLATGTYFGLDSVGTRIWQLLERLHRLDAVRDALVAEYEVEIPTAGEDLINLVDRLAAHGLVAIDA
jgi:hypothetical protein